MKTIGLIGGMSWESTVTYYKVINETVKEKLGGLHSAKCLLYSVDFEEIEACQAQGQWEESGIILTQAAQALERAGADFLVICTNHPAKSAPQIQRDVSIPLRISPKPRPGSSTGKASLGWDCWAPDTRWSRTSTRKFSGRRAFRF